MVWFRAVFDRRPALARVLAALVLPAFVSCGGTPEPAGNSAPAPAASDPSAAPKRVATAPAHGYGDAIAWRGLTEGFKEAAESGRPIMLVVHASWCSRCKALQPSFFDAALEQLSERFVMINVDQDREPEVLAYGPDGQYIPRVVFLDPSGKLDPELKNPKRSRYHYFYMPQDDLVGAMQRALDRHGKT